MDTLQVQLELEGRKPHEEEKCKVRDDYNDYLTKKD